MRVVSSLSAGADPPAAMRVCESFFVLRCQQSVDLACAARGTPVIEEDGGVGPGRLREHGSGGACGIARRGIDQIHGAARPEEVSDIEVSGARFASQRVRQMGAIAFASVPRRAWPQRPDSRAGRGSHGAGRDRKRSVDRRCRARSPWLPHPGQSGGLRFFTMPSQVCSMNWNRPVAEDVGARACGSSADSRCAVFSR